MAELVYEHSDRDDNCLQVLANDGATEVRVYRPGAYSTRYCVYLPRHEVIELALALAAHAHANRGERHE